MLFADPSFAWLQGDQLPTVPPGQWVLVYDPATMVWLQEFIAFGEIAPADVPAGWFALYDPAGVIWLQGLPDVTVDVPPPVDAGAGGQWLVLDNSGALVWVQFGGLQNSLFVGEGAGGGSFVIGPPVLFESDGAGSGVIAGVEPATQFAGDGHGFGSMTLVRFIGGEFDSAGLSLGTVAFRSGATVGSFTGAGAGGGKLIFEAGILTGERGISVATRSGNYVF